MRVAEKQIEPVESPVAETETSKLTVERGDEALALDEQLIRAMREHDKPYHHQVWEIAQLCFRGNRLMPGEYYQFGLFNDEKIPSEEKRRFVGIRAARKIWEKVNFSSRWFGVLDDKLAFNALLDQLGFSTAPTAAYFHGSLRLPGVRVLAKSADVEAFLREEADYPIFGKPCSGYQSLGSVSLDRYDAGRDVLVTLQGEELPVAELAAQIDERFRDGYIFQPRVTPHSEVREMCGDRLSTVRVLTMNAGNGPVPEHVVWKIPAAGNTADNYWRPGNIAAHVDPANGRVLRAVQNQPGRGATEIEAHPDTGVAIIGATVPNWDTIVETVRSAAEFFDSVNLIGWDIAPIDQGAMVVEANYTPDLFIHQIVEQRGILDERMNTLIEAAAHRSDSMKRKNREIWRQESGREARRLRLNTASE